MPDPADLARIHAGCFTTPRPWSASEIAALLAQPHVFLIGAPGGFLIGSTIAGEAELLTLAVLPKARRQGIGQALVAGFFTEALARGAERAFLEVLAENAPAIALYERAGFTRAGLRPGYYAAPSGARIDALVLSRALP